MGPVIHYTSHEIRRALDARVAAEVTPELSGARGLVLGEIVRANEEQRNVYQRDIEEWFHIRRSSVTTLLQGMEQDGFITRCAVAQDARLKRLVATEKGLAYYGRLRSCIDAFEAELQQNIDAADLAVTWRVLEQLLDNLSKMPQSRQECIEGRE